MELREYITTHHGGIRTIFQNNVLPGLTPEELAARPSPHSNSIAWLAWHCARAEDVAINTVLRGAEQVAATDGWNARLGVEATDLGTSMGDDEVATFAESIRPARGDRILAVGAEEHTQVAEGCGSQSP